MVTLREFLARHRIQKVTLAHWWAKSVETIRQRCNDDKIVVSEDGKVYKQIAEIPKELMK